ncbi:MAG TPA: ribosome maturation factor RimM [Acidimicrobiales bacterium]|jgi:16S rRNA processing protein RimM|nr:ribosome maturation factor RimM [Acidimicrobiales bacterium]
MLEVARVVRPHGLGGDVVVDVVTNRPERVSAGTELYASGRAGTPVPEVLHVAASRAVPGAGTHCDRWIVRFAGVSGREAAESLRGTVLSAAPLDEADVLWVHELIGAQVVDTDGQPLGSVSSVQANPASDLLVLDGGALVPLRFITDRAEGRLTVDLPPGLLDLY